MIPATEANQNRRKGMLLFVGLSVLAHLLLLGVLYRTELASNWTAPENTVYVDLDKLPPPQAAQPEDKFKGQIVETERSADTTPPKQTKFLSERNQSVKEETRAHNVDLFRKGGGAGANGTGGKPQVALKDLAPPSSRPVTAPTQAEIDGMREQQKKVARQEYNAGGEAAGGPGSATNDYLKDVKEGAATLLNTREFIYYSYFNRIRQRLEPAWYAKLRDRYAYSEGRRLANDTNYITGLDITLDRSGRIVAVKVLQKSGAHDLDDTAVGAFNEAGPFPNPPAGLIDKTGHVQLRWDFILQS